MGFRYIFGMLDLANTALEVQVSHTVQESWDQKAYRHQNW